MREILRAEQLMVGDRLESTASLVPAIVTVANEMLIATDRGESIFVSALQRLLAKSAIRAYRLESVTITDEHAASSYGIPVVLIDGELTDLSITDTGRQ